MIADERKPHLRKIWAEHKPSTWHTLIGTSITREEWIFLSSMWKDQQERSKPLKSNPTATTAMSIVNHVVAKVVKQLDDDDMQRLINDLC